MQDNSWKTHLQAASALLPVLADQFKTISGSYSGTLRSTTSNNREGSEIDEYAATLSSETAAALEFFTGVVFWFAIFSSISTGSSSFLHDQDFVLKNGDSPVRLEQLMGCQNWVMAIIMDIGILDDWKKHMRTKKCLSTRELVSRATAIETGLKSQIAKNLLEVQDLVERAQGTNRITKSTKRAQLIGCLTYIFARSALTYLYVIVSGFNPDLPEIQENVARTTAALQWLPDKQLLRHLVWAFYVTGCLTGEAGEASFRALLFVPGMSKGSYHECWTALEVMEMVWKRRGYYEDESIFFDWSVGLGLLDRIILLI